jgi:hypothetical protein
MISYIMRLQLSKTALLFVFYMAKIKRFSEMCMKKIVDGKSLCDLLL